MFSHPTLDNIYYNYYIGVEGNCSLVRAKLLPLRHNSGDQISPVRVLNILFFALPL